MAVVLTPLGKIVVGITKWIVVPLCAAAIGYVLIGPRIGASKAPGSIEGEVSEKGKRFKNIRGIE